MPVSADTCPATLTANAVTRANDCYSYNTVIGAAARNGDLDVARQTLRTMVANGVLPDAITANSLINAAAKGGDLKGAHLLFQKVMTGVSAAAVDLTSL
jgi:pentatricopeptide repeat protein